MPYSASQSIKECTFSYPAYTNSNIDEFLSDNLDSSSSSNEQEPDNFDEFQVTQDIKKFERNQENESFDTEIYDNSSTLHNNENYTENIPITHSNKQQSSHI
ncbi:295_t:CDS:2 [Cetraspora pellucida]|uniref:295_t:CDS:1 n=1 Tax=Cetraspora pellucida TaxID=1433469 RepID=A0A9N9H0V9_9GLOM|nr:295_t:CDS:2 [Cetraspora pellucida]